MRHCPKKNHHLDESEFGISRRRSDGLNRYCKSCIREISKVQHSKHKVWLASRKPIVRRKPMVKAIKRELKQGKPKVRILRAIENGARTRDEIKEQTGLHWDQLMDLIAELAFDAGQLKIDRQTGRIELAA